jgi:hypothetical protein
VEAAKESFRAQMKRALEADFVQWTPVGVATEVADLERGSDVDQTLAHLLESVEALTKAFKDSDDSAIVLLTVERLEQMVTGDTLNPDRMVVRTFLPGQPDMISLYGTMLSERGYRVTTAVTESGRVRVLGVPRGQL